MADFIKEPTAINDVFVITPTIFGDERGYFMETYNAPIFKKLGLNNIFIQDNQSKSKKGTLRGLHFQTTNPQAKLIHVIQGEVFDVVVDLRKDSATFGQHISVTLSGENHKILYIPRGFAHGFLVLSEEAIFCYKVDNFYTPEAESGIIWNDPDLNIQWPFTQNLILSPKDQTHQSFQQYKESLV